MSEIPSSLQARKEILNTVASCVTAERNVQHGDAAQNFHDTAAIWNIILGRKLKDPVTSKDVSVMMAGLKMARYVHDPNNIDTFVDMAGYPVCGGGIALAEQQAKKDAQSPEPANILGGPTQSHWIGKQDPITSCVITPEYMEETHRLVTGWHARNPSFQNACIYLSGKTFEQYMSIATDQMAGEHAYRTVPNPVYHPSIFAASRRCPHLVKALQQGYGGIVDLIERRAESKSIAMDAEAPAACPPPVNIFTQK